MSLSVYLEEIKPIEVYEANITHNLSTMAVEAGLYEALWCPESVGIIKAGQLIVPLTFGIALMKGDPDRYKKLNPENGWGTYDQFLPWLEKYLEACIQHQEAAVRVSG